MANIPYPLTATDIEELKRQVFELIRQVFEEKIGGADLGDVFSLDGDVLTLELASSSGLTKDDNELAIDPLSTGGLQVGSSGLSVKCKAAGGLASDASGLYVTIGVTGLGNTVVSETSFGQSATAGTSTDASRKDHTHGTPVDPVTAHVAAADPHTQYQKESEKDGASGYAGLNASIRTTKGVDTTDDIIVDLATKGLVLKDTQAPDPHYWRVTVENDGTLTTSDLGIGKP